ncbi:MAG: thiamine-phosphate kinase [Alphaproteobacteria bacterium]|nr:thiamine-phosphate kinase [Alphaproteobacteria bacterium]
MDEFGFIRDLMAPLARGAPGAYGLGDDAATIMPRPGYEIVVTTDALIAGVHFKPDDPPESIGRKALRVNLSDLAAKGADPAGFLLTLTLPHGTTDAWLRAFADGLATDVREFGVPLIGGDTTSTPGPLALSVTALGQVPQGQMIRRSGARPGDLLCVSGTIGDAALGLKSNDPALVDRYRLPRPRLALGIALRGNASAALDVSDGLVADVGHICEQSAVGATIEIDRLPLSPAARRALTENPRLMDAVLGGGDDYEIAFTLPDARRAFLEAPSEPPITVIGTIMAGTRVRVLDRAGIEYPVALPGYRHF